MKLLTVIGARPQFIKCASVSKVIRERNRSAKGSSSRINHIVVHTGQHNDYMMSKVFFDELGIPEPDYNLEVASGSHGEQTGKMLCRIEEVLKKKKPDVLLVYGDTNSTLAGALAASKLHIPVAHVEAGLRSFDRKMPEEINRVLTDHVSSLLFCPTTTAVRNLRKEGFSTIANDGLLVDDARTVTPPADGTPLVINVGDVMYDALLMTLAIAEGKAHIFEDLAFRAGITRYCLATVHRAENTDDLDRLDAIVNALVEIGGELPVVWPVHPRTRKILDTRYPLLGNAAGLRVIEPVGYLDMLMLEKHAAMILTDSGGVQKEAYWMRVPCVTLRDQTEWVETVESGGNVLAPPDRCDIAEVARGHISRPCDYGQRLYGGGDACEKVISLVGRYG